MAEITAEFVALMARTWHGIELDGNAADGIARMLRPMEAAAESAAADLDFESEPADFTRLLDELADGGANEGAGEG